MDRGEGGQGSLVELLETFVKRADDDRRAAFVLGISALSLLVDSGVATTDQAVARIDRVRDGLPENLRSERLDQHVKLAQDWLRLREEAVAAERGGPKGGGPKGGAEPPAAAPVPVPAAAQGRARWTPEVIAGGREPGPEGG
jgi:hypothetical protein